MISCWWSSGVYSVLVDNEIYEQIMKREKFKNLVLLIRGIFERP